MKIVMLNLLFMVLACLLVDSTLFAAEYWVSVDGLASGDGSRAKPFQSITRALEKVGGGHTFIFKPGYYNVGQITIWPKYSGTPQQPTILKSQEKYKAVLNGSPQHIIYVLDRCRWVIIDGFDVSGAFLTGVKMCGDYSVVRNCYIHNNSEGIEAHSVNNVVIERNLIEFNGRHPQFDHGIYADGNGLIIRNNVVRFNSSCGLDLAPQISESSIENNLIYGNHLLAIELSSAGKGKNRIVNNTLVENRLGIVINKGTDDIIANNIIWRNGIDPPIQNRSGSTFEKVRVEYNLMVPFMDIGEQNFSDDPLFLNPTKGWYYLRENSPARKKGLKKYIPPRDFFDKERKVDAETYIGCFEFNESLLQVETDRDLQLGWAYYNFHSDSSKFEPPDLWNPAAYRVDVNSVKMKP
jgi:hypothetical protein